MNTGNKRNSPNGRNLYGTFRKSFDFSENAHIFTYQRKLASIYELYVTLNSILLKFKLT